MDFRRIYNIVRIDPRRRLIRVLVIIGGAILLAGMVLINEFTNSKSPAILIVTLILIFSLLIFLYTYEKYIIIGEVTLSTTGIELWLNNNKQVIDLKTIKRFIVNYAGAEQDINPAAIFLRSMRENSGINNMILIETIGEQFDLNCLFIGPNEDLHLINYIEFLKSLNIEAELIFEPLYYYKLALNKRSKNNTSAADK